MVHHAACFCCNPMLFVQIQWAGWETTPSGQATKSAAHLVQVPAMHAKATGRVHLLSAYFTLEVLVPLVRDQDLLVRELSAKETGPSLRGPCTSTRYALDLGVQKGHKKSKDVASSVPKLALHASPKSEHVCSDRHSGTHLSQ